MIKTKWHALALTLVGLISCGGLEIAASTGAKAAAPVAAPVSGNRSVNVSGTAMPVGIGGTPRVFAVHRKAHHGRRSHHGAVQTASAPSAARKVAAAESASTVSASTNHITGVAIIPNDSVVRLTLEGTHPFTPDIAAMHSGVTPATIIHVPGVLSDGNGVGAIAVHRNGVLNVRYANQPNGTVQLVADTSVALVTEATSSADRKHWEIVLRRPAGAPTQVAMASGPSFKGYPVLTAAKIQAAYDRAIPTAAHVAATATPATVDPTQTAQAVTNVLAPLAGDTGTSGGVKPVTIDLPGGKTDTTKKPAVAKATKVAVAIKTPPVAHFVPSIIADTPAMAVPGTGEDRRVSLDVVAADINDVIKALALQSGINVVTSTDVKGSITVSLKRVPMIEALDTITRLSGYRYARLNSGYIVGTPASVAALMSAGRNVPVVTEYIRYRYLSQDDLYAALNSKFPGIQLPTTGGGNANPAYTKLLVLTDTPERIEQVRAFVSELESEVSEQNRTQVTELYKIRAANATDLIRLVAQLVPSVVIQIGPTQAFQASGSGGSQSTTPGGTFGPTTSTGGTSSGSSSGSGSASLNSPNTLVLTGEESEIARAKQILERVDVRTTQISYEARVVDIELSTEQQLGLRYDFSRSVTIGEKNETGSNTVGPSTAAVPASNVDFGAIYRSPYSIGVTLDMLATSNKARTLSSPNLSALDGQPATAFIGNQVKYVIAVQQTQQGQTIQTETATVGITLRVTGKSSPDGYITLYIHPEVSAITSFLTEGSSGISLPQISTRYVDTTVRVKSGETIAIGGLIQEQDIVNLQKLPVLGDLPVLGKLFRRTDKTKNRTEVVVFITARAHDDE